MRNYWLRRAASLWNEHEPDEIGMVAQQGVQWTGGYAARFLSFFAALSFLRFDGESRPTHLPLTRAVGCMTEGWNVVGSRGGIVYCACKKQYDGIAD
jgi:hypothetical protein